jgi:hypothetical protein
MDDELRPGRRKLSDMDEKERTEYYMNLGMTILEGLSPGLIYIRHPEVRQNADRLLELAEMVSAMTGQLEVAGALKLSQSLLKASASLYDSAMAVRYNDKEGLDKKAGELAEHVTQLYYDVRDLKKGELKETEVQAEEPKEVGGESEASVKAKTKKYIY